MKNLNKFQNFIDIARALKPVVQNYQYFHVAIIFKGKRVRSIGWNNAKKSNPIILKYPYKPNSRIHAEMSAILKIKNVETSNLNIIVMRIDDKGNLCNSKPCSGCEAMIHDFGFKNVYYSNEQGDFSLL